MRLTKGQIICLVNNYIGVCGGYLGEPESLRFSYRTHCEFYPEYCDLDSINPDVIEGTTREKFIAILLNAEPKVQAKIIRGIFKRFSPECAIADNTALAYNGIPTDLGTEFNKRKNIRDEYP